MKRNPILSFTKLLIALALALISVYSVYPKEAKADEGYGSLTIVHTDADCQNENIPQNALLSSLTHTFKAVLDETARETYAGQEIRWHVSRQGSGETETVADEIGETFSFVPEAGYQYFIYASVTDHASHSIQAEAFYIAYEAVFYNAEDLPSFSCLKKGETKDFTDHMIRMISAADLSAGGTSVRVADHSDLIRMTDEGICTVNGLKATGVSGGKTTVKFLPAESGRYADESSYTLLVADQILPFEANASNGYYWYTPAENETVYVQYTYPKGSSPVVSVYESDQTLKGERISAGKTSQYDAGAKSWVTDSYALNAGRTYFISLANIDAERTVFFSKNPIPDPAAKISIASAKVQVEAMRYTGGPLEPKPSVTLDDVLLEEGRDYTLSYENNIGPGTAFVIVKGIGNYEGEIRQRFNIAKGRQFLSADHEYPGLHVGGILEITVSGAAGELTWTVDEPGLVEVSAASNGITVKGLALGTTVIRLTSSATDQYLSASLNLTVTVAEDDVILINDAVIDEIADQAYISSPPRPQPGVRLNGTLLQRTRDYILSYKYNEDYTIGRVIVRGTGKYAGSVSKNFRIFKTGSSVTLIPESAELVYNGTMQLQAEVVPEGTTLTWSSSDPSVVTVASNGKVTAKNVGKAVVTATADTGVSASCEIRVLFSDAALSSQYFYDPVYWAVDHEITVGAGGPGKFSPNASCTREQFVTFLWRQQGKPAPKKEADFTDVPKGTWYYEPIAWAYENGITTGLNDGTGRFGVGQPCTREQCVTFLHRAAGKPAVGNYTDFTDVPKDKYFYEAISWAAEKRITVGLNDGTGRFGVGQNCTRGMLVTFLYRYANS